jgi:hypothetical protein
MSRVQLALNVGNLEEAIAFYSNLFAPSPPRSSRDTRTSPSPTRR